MSSRSAARSAATRPPARRERRGGAGLLDGRDPRRPVVGGVRQPRPKLESDRAGADLRPVPLRPRASLMRLRVHLLVTLGHLSRPQLAAQAKQLELEKERAVKVARQQKVGSPSPSSSSLGWPAPCAAIPLPVLTC